MAPDDPASATLAAIARKLDFMRPDIEEPGSSPAARLIAGHAALLLAAVEAVLKAADKWDVTADRLGAHHSRHRAFKMCAAKIREAITAALAGKDSSDEDD